MENRRATNDGEHVVEKCRATRPASHGHLRHFTARLGRRTACGSHIHFRAISPLASAVERPAARTFIFEPFHRSPRPSNGLRLAQSFSRPFTPPPRRPTACASPPPRPRPPPSWRPPPRRPPPRRPAPASRPRR